MPGVILVINAGSSSVKFSALTGTAHGQRALFRGQVEGIGGRPRFLVKDGNNAPLAEKNWGEGDSLDHDGAVRHLMEWIASGPLRDNSLLAVGHRVVHGGSIYTEPVLVDPEVLAELESFIPLAPLHQPHNLAAIRSIEKHAPGLPQIACFDTAFHRHQSTLAQTFAIPRKYVEEGVRRYGFHGLSYEYVASNLPKLDVTLAGGRVIVAHLGNGASMCAIHAGRSVASTMGFTALDGLPMGTRTGSVDPGVLLYLMRQHGMDATALERMLYHESGLLGLSEISSDMRVLLASDDPKAKLAVDFFVYRIGREIGSLAAALGGLEGIVFTGGIGENAAVIRRAVCEQARWLGVQLDDRSNDAGGPRITTTESVVSAWVVPTNEEEMIARHSLRLLRALPAE
ncbi:MAG: acetate/propionate family kinase [Planctomycetota bacterium]